MKKATCGHWRQYTAAMASFVMWLLLQSGDDWSWVIVGGFDSREDCREAREAHVLAPELLLCAVTDPQAAVAPAAPPAPRGRDRSPWEAGVVPYGRTEARPTTRPASTRASGASARGGHDDVDGVLQVQHVRVHDEIVVRR